MPAVTYDPSDRELRIRLADLSPDQAYQTFLFMGLYLQQLSHRRIQNIGEEVVAEMKGHEGEVRMRPASSER